MGKKTDKKDPYFEEKQGISEINNQLNKSYQAGVIEDKLDNNKDIYTYNNKSK